MVRTWSSGESEGEFIAKVADNAGYKKISVFQTIHDYPPSVMRGFLKSFAAEKVGLLRDLPPDYKDFKTEIVSARSKNPDAIYTCLMAPGDTGVFAKQARDLGWKIPIFGCESLEIGNFPSSQGALTGAWYVTGKLKPGFEAYYRQNFGEPGTLPGAGIHYDLARILAATTADSPQALVDEVLSRNWETKAMDALMPFKEGGDQALHVKLTAMHYKADGTTAEGRE